MSNIRKKKIWLVIKEISDAKRASLMNHANFDYHPTENNEVDFDNINITDFIKERTALYRESWIAEPLERAIEILRKELQR